MDVKRLVVGLIALLVCAGGMLFDFGSSVEAAYEENNLYITLDRDGNIIDWNLDWDADEDTVVLDGDVFTIEGLRDAEIVNISAGGDSDLFVDLFLGELQLQGFQRSSVDSDIVTVTQLSSSFPDTIYHSRFGDYDGRIPKVGSRRSNVESTIFMEDYITGDSGSSFNYPEYIDVSTSDGYFGDLLKVGSPEVDPDDIETKFITGAEYPFYEDSDGFEGELDPYVHGTEFSYEDTDIYTIEGGRSTFSPPGPPSAPDGYEDGRWDLTNAATATRVRAYDTDGIVSMGTHREPGATCGAWEDLGGVYTEDSNCRTWDEYYEDRSDRFSAVEWARTVYLEEYRWQEQVEEDIIRYEGEVSRQSGGYRQRYEGEVSRFEYHQDYRGDLYYMYEYDVEISYQTAPSRSIVAGDFRREVYSYNDGYKEFSVPYTILDDIGEDYRLYSAFEGLGRVNEGIFSGLAPTKTDNLEFDMEERGVAEGVYEYIEIDLEDIYNPGYDDREGSVIVGGPFIVDLTDPVVEADVESSGWTVSENVGVTFTNDGPSELEEKRYAVTESSEPLEESGSEWVDVAGSSVSIELETGGEWYIHAYAVDEGGNETYEVFGEYLIDVEPASFSVSPDDVSWVNTPVDIDMEFIPGGPSGIVERSYSLIEDGTWSGVSMLNIEVYDNEYTLTIDESGVWDLYVGVEAGNGLVTDSGGVVDGHYQLDLEDVRVEPMFGDSSGWQSGTISDELYFYNNGPAPLDDQRYMVSESSLFPDLADAGWNDITGIANYGFDIGGVTGSYYVHAYVSDEAGNEDSQTFGPYLIDMDDPTIDAVPDSSDAVGYPISAEVTFDDGGNAPFAERRYVLTEASVVPDEVAGDWVNLGSGSTLVEDVDIEENGEWYIHAYGQDEAGNDVEESFGPYHVDIGEPSIEASVGNVSWINEVFNFTLTYDGGGSSEINERRYIVTEEEVRPSLSSEWETSSLDVADVTLDDSGEFYVHAYVENEVYNEVFETFGPYQLDMVQPNTYISYTSFNWTSSSLSPLLGFNNDGPSGLADKRYVLTESEDEPADSSGAWVDVSEDTTNVSMEDSGIWYIHVYVEDEAGNEFRHRYGPYRIDKDDPEVMADPDNVGWTNGDVLVDVIYGMNGPSDFEEKRYAVTGSTDVPGEGSSDWVMTGVTTNEVMIEDSGEWYIHAYAEDEAGNDVLRMFGPYQVDKDLPNLDVNPESVLWTNDDVYVDVSFDGGLSGMSDRQYALTEDSVSPEEGNESWGVLGTDNEVITISDSGEWYIHVKGEDVAGNGVEGTFGPYQVDKEVPDVTANPESVSWTGLDVSVGVGFESGGYSDVVERRYAVTSSSEVPGESSGFWNDVNEDVTVDLDQNGEWYIHAYVETEAGNSEERTFGPYQLDKEELNVSVDPDSRSWLNESVNAEVTFDSGGLSDVVEQRYAVTSGNSVPDSTSSSWVSVTGDREDFIIEDNGEWFVHVFAENDAGNQVERTFGPYQVDKELPVLDVVPGSVSWTNVDVEATVMYDDGGLSGLVERRYAITESVIEPAEGDSVWQSVSSDSNDVVIENSGEWYIHVFAEDEAGNSSSATFGSYQIDKEDPDVTANPAEQLWVNEDVIVDLVYEDTGESGLEEQLYAVTESTLAPEEGSEDWTEVSGSGETVTIQDDGEWYIHASVEDGAGNRVERVFGPYQVDKINPTVDVDPESQIWINETVNVGVTFTGGGLTDLVDRQYAVTESVNEPAEGDGSWNSVGVNEVTVDLEDSGEWYVHVYGEDEAGNSVSGSFGPYQVDKENPDVVADPGERLWTNEVVYVDVDFVSGGYSGLSSREYVVTGSSEVPEEGSSGWESAVSDTEIVEIDSNGEWYIHAMAEDEAGNGVTRTFGPYQVDMVDPVVSVDPGSQTWTNVDVEADISFVEGGLSDFVERDYAVTESNVAPVEGSGDWTSTSVNEESVSIVDDGEWYIHVSAEDEAGNSVTESFGPYQIDKESPDVTADVEERLWSAEDVDVVLTFVQGGLSDLADTRYAVTGDAVVPGDGYSGWSSAVDETVDVLIEDDGEWFIHAYVEDVAGNNVQRTFGPYQIDEEGPGVDVTPDSQGWINETVTADIVFTDGGFNALTSRRYAVSDSSVVPDGGSGEWVDVLVDEETLSLEDTGEWFIHAYVEDESGRSLTRTFGPYQVDKETPEIGISYTSFMWTNSTLSPLLTFTGGDPSGFDERRYALTTSVEAPDSGDWNNVMDDVNVAISESGEFYIHAFVADVAGNTNDRTYGPYQVDLEAPDVPEINMSTEAWVNEPVTFTITNIGDTGGSGVDRVEYRENGGSWQLYEEGEEIEITRGGYTDVEARVWDNAGNMTREDYVPRARIDYGSPDIYFSHTDDSPFSPQGDTELAVEMEDTGSTSSGLDGYRYVWTGSDEVPEDSVFGSWVPGDQFNIDLISELDNGVHYLHVEARDNAGNETYEVRYYRVYKSVPDLEIVDVSERDGLGNPREVEMDWLMSFDDVDHGFYVLQGRSADDMSFSRSITDEVLEDGGGWSFEHDFFGERDAVGSDIDVCGGYDLYYQVVSEYRGIWHFSNVRSVYIDPTIPYAVSNLGMLESTLTWNEPDILDCIAEYRVETEVNGGGGILNSVGVGNDEIDAGFELVRNRAYGFSVTAVGENGVESEEVSLEIVTAPEVVEPEIAEDEPDVVPIELGGGGHDYGSGVTVEVDRYRMSGGVYNLDSSFEMTGNSMEDSGLEANTTYKYEFTAYTQDSGGNTIRSTDIPYSFDADGSLAMSEVIVTTGGESMDVELAEFIYYTPFREEGETIGIEGRVTHDSMGDVYVRYEDYLGETVEETYRLTEFEPVVDFEMPYILHEGSDGERLDLMFNHASGSMSWVSPDLQLRTEMRLKEPVVETVGGAEYPY